MDKPTPEPTSYATYMLFAREPATTNILRFATSREAEDYGLALFSRWTQPIGYEVRPTTDPVSHCFVDGHAQALLSWSVYYRFNGEFTTNAQHFATRDEAVSIALATRWYTAWKVRQTTQPVNYRFVDGHAVSIHTTPYDAAYDAVASGALPEGAGDASAERESPLEGETTDASN